MNPLDRNHDGKVNLSDLSGRQNTTGLAGNDRNHNGIPDNREGLGHNPLDRNHDGRVDLKDLHAGADRNHNGIPDNREGLAMGQAGYVQPGQRASVGLVRAEPTIMETIQKNVVVHEHIHPVQKEEIQPVIYREREQLDVKQVTQLMHETQIQPTLVQQRELPAERREAIIERGAPIAENYIAPSREVDATMRTQVVHAPIVNEVIKKTVIEEIQPVLERDIIQSTVIQNTQPIYEKIIEAPHVSRSVTTVIDRGVVGGDLSALQSQGFNIGESGRRLSQGYGVAPLAGLAGNDRNHNGIPDNREFGQTGLAGAHHNPLDRNHDGRVDMNDLTGRQTGMMGQQGLVGQQGMMGQPVMLTHRGAQPMQGGNLTGSHNPLDRNHDGRVDMNDLSGRQTGLGQQGYMGQPGMVGQQGMMGQQGIHANPLDRNHDGRVDMNDLTGRQTGLGQQGMMGQQGYMGQPGMVGQQGIHANPLDRNHDGRVDMNDLTGRQTGLGQQGMMGQQGLAGQQGIHANPLDRNHDGKVDLKDLSGRQTGSTSQRPVNLL